jgi:nicotinamidase-related amidase
MTTPRDVLEWHAELDTGEVEPHPAFSLYPGSTALLVIDLQARLGEAVDQAVWARTVKNTTVLLEAARRLGLPVIATEQDPETLGPTEEAVRAAFPEGLAPVRKMDFNCGALDAVRGPLRRDRRRQLVVAGMETHVCVFQSVRYLVERGFFVHVVADAVCSRGKENWRRGLELMAGAGATVTSTETVVYDLLQTAEHPEFEALTGLLR